MIKNWMVKNLIAFFFIDRQKTPEIRDSRLEYPLNINSVLQHNLSCQEVLLMFHCRV